MRCQKCDYGYVKAGENLPFVYCKCCGGFYVNCKNCKQEAENDSRKSGMVSRVYGDEKVQEAED